MTSISSSCDVHIIGGGLAGSEAAWQLARRGLRVRLSELRGAPAAQRSPAHQTDSLAELVCSNSLRSDDDTANAVGLLHHEMRALGSLVMAAADGARVPAGSALAVDRDAFSADIERRLAALPNLTIIRERIDTLPPAGLTIVATGPLTSGALAASIGGATGEALAFFDAIAPIVYHETIDMSVCWRQSRWNKASGPGSEGKDYINCAMDKAQYLAFHAALLAGDKAEAHAWEKDTPYFNGCMPIEVMAERGVDTLRFGPMKPVGLDDPRTGRWPYAVVQLRQDNALGTLWNMVGFQTKLRHAEQIRIFRTIPGLAQAEFARLGGLHRNTFLHAPRLLDRQLRLTTAPHIRFAGQITGCEGYVESAAIGLLAGLAAAAEVNGTPWQAPPRTTALGSLLAHITHEAEAETYQPMNINFGLFPPLEPDETGSPAARSRGGRKASRKAAYTERAKAALVGWLPFVAV